MVVSVSRRYNQKVRKENGRWMNTDIKALTIIVTESIEIIKNNKLKH